MIDNYANTVLFLYFYDKGNLFFQISNSGIQQINKGLFSRLIVVFLYHEAIPPLMFSCSYPVCRCSFHFHDPAGNNCFGFFTDQPSKINTRSASIIFWCQWSVAFNRDDQWANQADAFHSKCILQDIPFVAECIQDSTFGTTGTTKILFRKCTVFTE